MKDFELDAQLRETLHACVDHMEAEDDMKVRIDKLLENKQSRRRKPVWRKLAVGLAAALCLTTVGAFARGQVAYLVSSLRVEEMRFSVGDLQKDAEKIDADICIPESLAGYAFQKGSIQYTDKMDENNNRFGTYPEISADYGTSINADDRVLMYTARKYDAELDEAGLLPQDYEGQPYEVREMNGIEVFYRADAYLFVPVGYELTAEEQARMDANELYVSEGSDEREEELFQIVTWQVDDVVYGIYNWNASMTAEEMFAAAEDALT